MGLAATRSSTETVFEEDARRAVPEGIGRTDSMAAACLKIMTELPPTRGSQRRTVWS
jgi:hypothetical protein